MAFDSATIEPQLDYLVRRQLLGGREPDQVLELIGWDHDFAEVVAAAASIHVHVKVDDLTDLPHEELTARGRLERWKAPGYVKYQLPGQLNVIFSSFPIAQDDLIKGAVTTPKPFADHFGIDLRSEDDLTRQRFDSIEDLASSGGWRAVRQGGPGRPVYGAHTKVAEKRWVFAPGGVDDWRRPTEYAFGRLIVDDSYLGCDHRPIDPAHPLATQAPPWEETRRAALGDEMKGIVVYVRTEDDRRAAEESFRQLEDAPPCCRLRTKLLSYDAPEEFPEVAVVLWRLKDACPLPLTVVDGYPVVSQRLPSLDELLRFTTVETTAPAPEVFA
jgi:ribosomal protein S13